MPRKKCAVSGCSYLVNSCMGRIYCWRHQKVFDLYGDPTYHPEEYKHGPTHGNFKHGKPPEYGIWRGMKARCYYEKHSSYSRYGGRGIKVCDRWLGEDGFKRFLEDMGPRPEGEYPNGRAKYSIDRIDVNGDYCPKNCRWATVKEQSNNKSTNHKIQGKTLAEWGEELGGSRHMLRKRLQYGWSEKEATTLVASSKARKYR